MLENHAFCDWSRSSTLSCCSCCKLQCCSILLLPLIMMQSYRQSEFSAISVSRIPANSARRVTPTWNVYRAKFDPGWEGYPEWQTGLPALAGHPTYHVHEIKLKWEIIWTGGLPNFSGLSHLPGSPPPCKQALRLLVWAIKSSLQLGMNLDVR